MSEAEFGLSYGAGYLSVAISSMYACILFLHRDEIDGLLRFGLGFMAWLASRPSITFGQQKRSPTDGQSRH